MPKRERKKLRILHTSDLHLEILGDNACRSLKAVVEMGIDTKADLILIAGDFFDSNRVKDDVVSLAVTELLRASIPTVILPGNHDCLVPDSVYNRMDLWEKAANVRILRASEGESVSLGGLGISVWGKPLHSYSHDPAPLGGMPRRRGDGRWHIALAHGYFNIEKEAILNSRRDYVALGDSHAFDCVCSEPVKACYSGSPSSGTQSVAIVDLDETGVHVRCHWFAGGPVDAVRTSVETV